MIEKNIIIAEFMGISVMNIKDYREYLIEMRKNGIYYSPKYIVDEDLDYHEDWNNLIYVIKRCLIGEAELEPQEYKEYITPIYEGLYNLDIRETHQAVVNFIKWYNKK